MKLKLIYCIGLVLGFISCVTGASDHGSEVSVTPIGPNAKAYYVDAQHGNDQNSGTAADQAWKTLQRASLQQLSQGDCLLLKSGLTYNGELHICGKGTKDAPIVVSSYGEGPKPIVMGADTSMWAVRIFNSDYLTLKGIEVVNTGSERRAGRTGVKVECVNYGISHNIELSDLFIHDVNGSLVKDHGGGSAILIQNGGDSMASRFDGLLIENCHIKDCARNAMIWSGYYDRRNWLPNTGVVVRGNLIEGVPGDGIVPIGCDGTLIEYNVMRDCPDILPADQAAAGIWPWSCDNTIIQFNEVSDHKAPWDAQGYDCDYNCRNTIIQYNYSHDNYGGLVLICDSGKERSYSLGNQGSIVRYNVSIGDGIRPKETRNGMFSPSIHIAGRVENTLVECNILHQNVKPSSNIDCTMVCSDSWDGFANATTLRRNIFYTPSESDFDMGKSTANVWEGNWFLGAYGALPADKSKSTASGVYQAQVLAVDPTGYKGLEKFMDQREMHGVECHFVNKDAIENFFAEMTKE